MNLIEKYELKDPPTKFRLRKEELITSTMAVNFLSLALPIMVLQVYDRIIVGHNTGTLVVLVCGVVLAIFCEAILRIARSYTTGWNAAVYEYTLAANAMKRYINADQSKLKQEGAGRQLQNLGAFTKLRDFYGGQAMVSLIDVPFAGVFLILISYIAGKLVFVPIVLIAVFTILTWFMGNKLMHNLESQGVADDNRYNFIIETLQGIHSIKSYGVEAIFKRRYERMEEDCSIANYNTALTSIEGYTFGVLFNEVMIIAVVSCGAPMVINGEFSTGGLIATVLLSGRLMQPIQKALFLWTQFQEYRISSQTAENIFSIHQVKRDEELASLEKKGIVELDGVSFSYGSNKVFDKVSLKVNFPEVVSIHGPNSSGKTTLLKLIAGITEASEGVVKVDGIKSLDFSSEELIKHVALIAPESVIFQGTIMENLTGFDESKEEKVIELANLLGLDKEIASLPHGYETKLNDGFADTIAPGIKQRITIMRVLLNKPKIILFNNADKGLDKEGYNYLIRLLNMLKGKATMILTTDDQNINMLADRHFLLSEGRLQEVEAKNAGIFEIKPYRELKL